MSVIFVLRLIVQFIYANMDKKSWRPSYATRRTGQEVWTYDSLSHEVLSSKQDTIEFLMDKGVIKQFQQCPKCSGIMKITKCSERDAVEEVQFRCQKRHYESSIPGTLHGACFCDFSVQNLSLQIMSIQFKAAPKRIKLQKRAVSSERSI